MKAAGSRSLMSEFSHSFGSRETYNARKCCHTHCRSSQATYQVQNDEFVELENWSITAPVY